MENIVRPQAFNLRKVSCIIKINPVFEVLSFFKGAWNLNQPFPRYGRLKRSFMLYKLVRGGSQTVKY